MYEFPFSATVQGYNSLIALTPSVKEEKESCCEYAMVCIVFVLLLLF